MTGNRARAVLLAALMALVPPAFAAQPCAGPDYAVPFTHGLLFRIDVCGKPSSYVFGTLHSNAPRVARLTPEIEAALLASRRLAPEVMMYRSEQEEFFAAAQFDDARRLADHFDADTLSRIRIVLGANAPPAVEFDRLKPFTERRPSGADSRAGLQRSSDLLNAKE